MRIKEGYLLDSIGEQKVAVALEHSEDKFSGIIKLNEVGAFLWERLQEETDEETLINALTGHYCVDRATAQADIQKFVKQLSDAKVLEV